MKRVIGLILVTIFILSALPASVSAGGPIAPHVHEWVVTENVAPNCTEEGYEVSICSGCGVGQTKTYAALGHQMVMNVKIAPTCTEWGGFGSICTRCGFYDDVSLDEPPLGHDLSELVVMPEPDCFSDGEVNGYCKRCRQNVVERLPALGHDFSGEWVVEFQPTPDRCGWRARKCIRCDMTNYEDPKIVEYIPGDANGDEKLTAKDLSLLKRVVAGGAVSEFFVEGNADVNYDGKFTAKDISELKRIIAGA
ncbi:MAG: dockerin type I repeat-containing protein [Clostridia bacterium]|nr:dockerin type I repeat-containing protein [Clostridia bacterium]